MLRFGRVLSNLSERKYGKNHVLHSYTAYKSCKPENRLDNEYQRYIVEMYIYEDWFTLYFNPIYCKNNFLLLLKHTIILRFTVRSCILLVSKFSCFFNKRIIIIITILQNFQQFTVIFNSQGFRMI